MPRDEVEKVVEMCKSKGVSMYTWLLLLAREDLESWEKQTVHKVSGKDTFKEESGKAGKKKPPTTRGPKNGKRRRFR